jgi:hypothetical protein
MLLALRSPKLGALRSLRLLPLLSVSLLPKLTLRSVAKDEHALSMRS